MVKLLIPEESKGLFADPGYRHHFLKVLAPHKNNPFFNAVIQNTCKSLPLETFDNEDKVTCDKKFEDPTFRFNFLTKLAPYKTNEFFNETIDNTCKSLEGLSIASEYRETMQDLCNRVEAVETVEAECCPSGIIDGAIGEGKVLRPYQQRAVQALQTQRGVLLVHGTGSGKTMSAIVASRCFLENNPTGRVVFIAPNVSILDNFKQSLDAYYKKTKPNDESYKSRYETSTIKSAENIIILASDYIRSYKTSTSAKNIIISGPFMLIVDEAHNINNVENDGFKDIFKLAKRAKRVLLLSATPITNYVNEMVALLLLMNPKLEGTYLKSTGSLIPMTDTYMKNALLSNLTCSISFYRASQKDIERDYPSTIIKQIYIVMGEDDLKNYNSYENTKDTKQVDDPEGKNTFMVSTRQFLDTAEPKHAYIKKLLNDLVLDRSKQIVIYSPWAKSVYQDTIKPYLEQFKTEHPPFEFAAIEGSIKPLQRKDAVENFNKGIVRVLYISKAGGEGIDLKKTTDIVILSPHWNESRIMQVMGRGVRYQSHTELLPDDQRVVTIHKLYLIKPADVWYIPMTFEEMEQVRTDKTVLVSNDMYYAKRSLDKQKVIDDFLTSAEGLSIEWKACGIEQCSPYEGQEVPNLDIAPRQVIISDIISVTCTAEECTVYKPNQPRDVLFSSSSLPVVANMDETFNTLRSG